MSSKEKPSEYYAILKTPTNVNVTEMKCMKMLNSHFLILKSDGFSIEFLKQEVFIVVIYSMFLVYSKLLSFLNHHAAETWCSWN